MRLHLVDGTYELFRAHFSHRPEHRYGGRDLKGAVEPADSTALGQLDFLFVAGEEAVRAIRVSEEQR